MFLGVPLYLDSRLYDKVNRSSIFCPYIAIYIIKNIFKTSWFYVKNLNFKSFLFLLFFSILIKDHQLYKTEKLSSSSQQYVYTYFCLYVSALWSPLAIRSRTTLTLVSSQWRTSGSFQQTWLRPTYRAVSCFNATGSLENNTLIL